MDATSDVNGDETTGHGGWIVTIQAMIKAAKSEGLDQSNWTYRFKHKVGNISCLSAARAETLHGKSIS